MATSIRQKTQQKRYVEKTQKDHQSITALLNLVTLCLVVLLFSLVLLISFCSMPLPPASSCQPSFRCYRFVCRTFLFSCLHFLSFFTAIFLTKNYTWKSEKIINKTKALIAQQPGPTSNQHNQQLIGYNLLIYSVFRFPRNPCTFTSTYRTPQNIATPHISSLVIVRTLRPQPLQCSCLSSTVYRLTHHTSWASFAPTELWWMTGCGGGDLLRLLVGRKRPVDRPM